MQRTSNNKLNLLFCLVVLCTLTSVNAQQKSRLIVLADIGGDPDDQMSMVRLLTYANHFDIE